MHEKVSFVRFYVLVCRLFAHIIDTFAANNKFHDMPYSHDVHFQGGPCSCSYSFGEKSHEYKSKKNR